MVILYGPSHSYFGKIIDVCKNTPTISTRVVYILLTQIEVEGQFYKIFIKVEDRIFDLGKGDGHR